eukprot:g4726.t1
MCKFILQEANEKAAEIRVKTEDKQLRVLAANRKTDEDFKKKIVQLDADKKVAKSKAVADSRKKKGEAANDLVREVHAHALNMLAANVKANPAGYKQLLVRLMSEGLVQIDEPVVTVECLASEADMIQGLCDDALKQYKDVVAAQFKNDPIKYASQHKNSKS